MKFKSKKGIVFGVVILGAALTLFTVVLVTFIRNGRIDSNIIISSLLIVFLLWIWFGTYYSIKDDNLITNFGPFRGRIKIKDIHKLIKNKTLWSGIKPALATKGIIVRYNQYDELYISPKDKEGFIKEVIKINQAIEIVG